MGPGRVGGPRARPPARHDEPVDGGHAPPRALSRPGLKARLFGVGRIQTPTGSERDGRQSRALRRPAAGGPTVLDESGFRARTFLASPRLKVTQQRDQAGAGLGRARPREMKIALLSGREGHTLPFETAQTAGSQPPQGDSIRGVGQHPAWTAAPRPAKAHYPAANKCHCGRDTVGNKEVLVRKATSSAGPGRRGGTGARRPGSRQPRPAARIQ